MELMKALRSNEVFFTIANYPDPNISNFNGCVEFAPRRELNKEPMLYARDIQLVWDKAINKFKLFFILGAKDNKTLNDNFHIAANKIRLIFDKRDKGLKNYGQFDFDNVDLYQVEKITDSEFMMYYIMRGFCPSEHLSNVLNIGEPMKRFFKINGVEIYV